MAVYVARKIVGKQQSTPYKINPLLYFSRNFKKHPNLSRVAMRILSRQASSAEPERRFSDLWHLSSGKKNKIGMAQIKARSQVKSFLKYHQ